MCKAGRRGFAPKVPSAPKVGWLLLKSYNTFAGFLSEIIVKNLAEQSEMLVRNIRIGGYPDLVPRDKYPNNSVLRGEGVEVKASRQKGGWQGHNPEEGWIIIFQYLTDTKSQPVENRRPTEIVEVYAADFAQ